MEFLIAFVAGASVSFAAIAIPHSRNPKDSIEEFETLQQTLSTLPVTATKTRHK